ncbi:MULTISPECIES: sugar kinase [Dethiosulfovibrio]|jgi:2-dehydro-3-deoxygluconokinase|uniref:Sugar kinase n=2 Tax=Dethiosulfovibrio TaxID=47054 RepID=A0ABS9ENM9_9BACT|nr:MULTISPECIES: sugar kinase [Dethiosulfovibrio]MCF4114568.1 sugar kinase [Dethiosulfovibrio russensis]MCF4142792.1 sugar kinase [Dethiosulfovibrio marinus]MCF4144879.1 sugar kinase [Dethiosulfovibrio acidaminovorans]MEA3283972.1 sugar kinase [Synergistota bacterium]
MAAVVTFGEIMLRLSPKGKEKLFQTSDLVGTFGGAEGNVAVSLANYGEDVALVTALPANPIGDACVAELRRHGVDTSLIRRSGDRVGIYYAETGACCRPSKVVYDRADSSIARAKPGDFDWDAVLEEVQWFHTTGITPAVAEGTSDLVLEALRACKRRGITVSCDLNYRKKLWKWGKPATEVMTEIAEYVDVAIANEEDCQKSLGIQVDSDVTSGKLDRSSYEKLGEKVLETYPNMKSLAVTLRESHSADHNGWSAMLATRGEDTVFSRRYDITPIVDRIGGGDSFGAGLIHGMRSFESRSDALEFAVAASALKHTVYGDFNLVSREDVLTLMGGDGSGRVQR